MSAPSRFSLAMGLDRLNPHLREIGHRAWPVIAANITVPLVGLVDTAIAGRMEGVQFLAAVGLGSGVFHFLVWLFGFLRMGTTGVTAQGAGRKDTRAISLSLIRGAGFGAMLGVVLLLVSPLLVALALTIYAQDPALAAPFALYLQIRFVSAPFVLATYVFYGWFLGVDRNRTMMAVHTAVVIINALLSPIFAIGFGWGVAGIAWASVLAEISGAALALTLAVRIFPRLPFPRLAIPLKRADIFNVHEVSRFFRINSDIFFRTLCLLLTFQLFWFLSTRQGTLTLSVNAILLQFLTFSAFALDGFAFVGEAMVGEQFARLGGDKRALVPLRRVVRALFLWAGACAFLFFLAYLVSYRGIVALLTDIESVRNAAQPYALWASALPLVGFAAYMWDGVFLGLTLTRRFLMGMLSAALLYVPCALLLGAWLGNSGLWIALYIFLVLRAIFLQIFWRHWQRKLQNDA